MSAIDPVACRMCGHPIERKCWGGGECPACGSVSVIPVPSPEELTAFYNNYNKTYTGGGRSGGKNQRRYAQRYLQLVWKYAKTGRMIDVGSSTSPFPNMAADRGFEVTVMDYIQPRELRPGVRFIEGNLNEEQALDRHRNSFDVVTSWAVLEHVLNPKLAISILGGMCRPEGMVLVSTPEIGTFLTNHSMGRSRWFSPPKHLHLISPVAMIRLFAEHDCDLIVRGRLELNPFRYAARYGIGAMESIIGLAVKKLSLTKWQAMRDSRRHRFCGISFFVFRRRSHR